MKVNLSVWKDSQIYNIYYFLLSQITLKWMNVLYTYILEFTNT